MIYKQFQDMPLSALGYGCMRFPTVDGDVAAVNEEEAAKLIARAMEGGVNYYDTAWGYHGGNSEAVMGRILKGYPRDSFYLADKFPGYDLSNMDKVEEIFDKQLEKCQVEYFDFYLFHNVCEMNIAAYLDPKYHIYDSLVARKKAGQIKHLGFSCHGSLDTLSAFLDYCGDKMEFCQLQLNYLDWTLQHGREKYELLTRHGIPVWVMEPVRGGRLARLSDSELAPLRQLRPGDTGAAWAFRFLQGLPNVKMILSGMSSLEQMAENTATLSVDQPLTQEELAALLELAETMKDSIPCTACRYCCDGCPMGLDIPAMIAACNEARFALSSGIRMRFDALPEDKRPAAPAAKIFFSEGRS